MSFTFIDYIEIVCGVVVLAFFIYLGFTLGWFRKD